MKFDEMQNKALEEAVWKRNEPLFQGAFQKYNVPISEEVKEAVKLLCKRLDAVVPLTFEEFQRRWPEKVEKPEKFGLSLDEKRKTKTGFPVLYMYVPELQLKLLEAADQKQRETNCAEICKQLKKYTGLEATDELKEFIRQSLPLELPKKFYFDGSFERVKKLATETNVRSYADEASKNIGVIRTMNDEEVLTLFVEGIDYVASFAKFMAKKLEIDMPVAMKISSALTHDVYYGIRGYVDNDFDHHVTLMAQLLQVSEGDSVHDLYQGDVVVKIGAFSRKLGLNLDDEHPSAVLVGTKVYVYLPANKKNENQRFS